MLEKRNKVVLGSQIGLITSLVILITNFFLRSYFVKVYGADLTGYYLLIVQLMGMLNLAELGVGTALTYILFKPLHDGNKSELREYYYVTKKIYNAIAITILIVGILFAVFLRKIVDADISDTQLYLPWLIFVISTSLSYCYSSQSVLLTADQNVYLVKLFTGIAKSATYSLQIGLMIFGVSFWVVCSVELFSSIVLIIIFNILIKKRYPYLFNSELVSEKERVLIIKNKIKKEIKFTFVHKFASVAVFNTDYLIISIYLGVSIITSFSSYLMLIQALGFIIAAVASPLGSFIGATLHREGASKVISVTSFFNSIFFIVGAFSAYIFYLASTAFVSLWMGPSIILDQQTVFLLSVNCFVLVARTSFDAAKIGLGYMSDIELPILEAVLNIILSLVLVRFYDLDGVILGTIISNVIVVLILKPIYLYKKALKQNKERIIKELLRLWMMVIFFVFLVLFLVQSDSIVSNSWSAFIISVVEKSLLPLLIILLCLLWDGNIRRFIKKHLPLN